MSCEGTWMIVYRRLALFLPGYQVEPLRGSLCPRKEVTWWLGCWLQSCNSAYRRDDPEKAWCKVSKPCDWPGETWPCRVQGTTCREQWRHLQKLPQSGPHGCQQAVRSTWTNSRVLETASHYRPQAKVSAVLQTRKLKLIGHLLRSQVSDIMRSDVLLFLRTMFWLPLLLGGRVVQDITGLS